jgi:hypothetical protein
MLKRMENYRKYHIPGCSNYYRRPKNAIYINPANSLKHEIGKLTKCYELRKIKHEFITEAVENATGLRRDIVDMDDGEKYEIETDKLRAERHNKDINVVMVE